MRTKQLYSSTKKFFDEFLSDNPLRLAASLSYYTLLSLAPLLLVVVALAGLIFGREAVQGRIVYQMNELVGDAGAKVVQEVLAHNAQEPARGALSLAIGIITLLIGATTVFIELQSALNKIWNVEARPRASAIGQFVKDRLLSLAMVLGVGFLLLVSLVISAALEAFGAYAAQHASLTPMFWQVVNTGTSFVIIALLLAMIFRFLPDVQIAWRDVWFGAFVTSLLFSFGKYLIGVYLGRVSIGSSYGAAGSIVVLMVWVYYAALIVFLGAEITQVHAKHSHKRVRPVAYAVKRKPACNE